MSLLRIASCQFPVGGDIAANADYICRYMRKATAAQADVFHTSEASLSGYAGHNFKSFADFDWDLLRRQTARIQELAHSLGLWVVLGSAHWLGPKHKPTNCLYLIGPDGRIADRYDKCMCTGGDQYHYSGGRHLVTRQIKGVRVGLAICYDVCYPEIYAAYRRLGVSLMLHSFHNAGSAGPSCLDVLNGRQVATRCADNRMWAVANNSSAPYSHWGSFVARPDATIAMTLGRNRAGMLVYDFDKELSTGGWFHNNKPMKLHPREVLHYGKPTAHARQLNRRSKP
ncbi:MAG: carbon-nitrogen hydrolase family protein [Planctomycetaceae bacterium]|nr:carbon-nitrogen hydrolase family protein [Planctomycetaceae bacterium]